MAPLIVLIVVALLARLIGQLGVAHFRDWAASARVGLAAMLCVTAAAHFNSMRPDMVAMVPPSVPNPEFMVTFTGQAGVTLRGAPATPIVPRVALQLLFIALLWWSGVRSHRSRNDAVHQPGLGMSNREKV